MHGVQAPLMADMRREGGFSLPFQPKVSAVYQRFTLPEEGVVQNIIQVGFVQTGCGIALQLQLTAV